MGEAERYGGSEARAWGACAVSYVTPLLPNKLALGWSAVDWAVLGISEWRLAALSFRRADGGRRTWTARKWHGAELGVAAGVDIKKSAAGQNTPGERARQTENGWWGWCVPTATA